MTQTEMVDAVKANEAKKVAELTGMVVVTGKVHAALHGLAEAADEATQAVQTLVNVLPQGMKPDEIQAALVGVHGETAEGKNDGTRMHLHYKAFGVPTLKARQCAARAAELGLPLDRYTGRVTRVWKSKEGHNMITMMVELERDHMFRTFNLDRGQVFRVVKLGE